MRVVLYRDRKHQWRFRVLADNGEIVAQSESYSRRIDAEAIARDLTGVKDIEVEDG